MENQKAQFQNQRNVEKWTCPCAFILFSRFVFFCCFYVAYVFSPGKKNKKWNIAKTKNEKHNKSKKRSKWTSSFLFFFCMSFAFPFLFPFYFAFVFLDFADLFCLFFFHFVCMFYRFVSNLLILRVSNGLVNKNLNIHKLEIICFWDTTIPIIIYGYLWILMGLGHLPKLNQPVFAEITLSPDDAHGTLPRR